MADLNTLTQTVIKREEQKFQSQLESFKEQRAEELDQTKQELIEANNEAKDKIENELDRDRDVSMKGVELKGRNERLAIKQELTARYIDDVYEMLIQISPDMLRDFVWNIINQLSSRDNIRIIFGNLHYEMMQPFFDDFRHQNIAIAEETIQDDGGFIIEQGSIQYNYKFSNLMDDIYNQLQFHLMEKLGQDN